VSTEYVGFNSFPVTVTIPTDDDEFDAASVAVPLEQLADRTKWLEARVDGSSGGAEFTDATFHGTTTFADGTIIGALTGLGLEVDNASTLTFNDDLTVSVADDLSVAAIAGSLFLGGNDIELGSTTTVTISATTDMIVNVGDDLVVDVNGDANIDIAGALNIQGIDSIDISSGTIIWDPSTLQINQTLDVNGNVSLGTSTASTIEVEGSFTAKHNSTFAAGKVVDLDGSTRADELRATVSNSAGITYSGQGRAHYRDRLMVDADFSGGPFMMHPDTADFFYVDSLSANRPAKVDTGGSSIDGDVIEVSTLGMTGGFNLEIYAADEVTLLLTMTATTNSWSRWKRMTGGAWRIIAVSDG
jgi:hypothetical protein